MSYHSSYQVRRESKTEIIDMARSKVAEISKAKEEIQEKALAIAELKSEVATLAVMAAERILGKSMDPRPEKLVKILLKSREPH